MQNLLLHSFVAFFCAAGAFGTELSGHIQVLEGSERGNSETVVYAEPLGEHAPPKPGHYELKQRNKTFVPHVLAVPAGSVVAFPNNDPIFHNVFSLSRPAPFDLGLYRAGESKTRIFTQPAIYHIFCNIHPQMSALLLVLPTSFITEANAQGMYRMEVPPGQYRVTAWSERSQPATVTVDVSVESVAVKAPEMTLDESKFVEIPHENKYGHDYFPSTYETLNR
jgi:plastocyanin